MRFLPHQRETYEAIRSESHFEYWSYGAIGTGKTVGIAAGFTRKVLDDPGPYFLGNSTAGNVWAVQWPLIRGFARRAGVKAKRGRDGELPVVWVGGSKLWVLGLKNKGSMDAAMGRNTKGGWYEEINKCDEESIDLSFGRARLPRALIMCGMNPEGPRHWTADRIRDAGNRMAWVKQTKLSDNPFLPKRYVEYLHATYTLPHLRARYIDGEFAAGEGLVYQYVPSVEPGACRRDGRMAIVADAGMASVTAALYAWEQPGGTWVIADEYYYDSSVQPQLGDAEHAGRIMRRHNRTPDVLVADGANLRYELSKLGVYARTPVKDIAEDVNHFDSCLRRHDIVFLEGSCEMTRREMDTLEWDEKARERGEDMPVDGDDHGADCGKYLARAVVPKYGKLPDIDLLR